MCSLYSSAQFLQDIAGRPYIAKSSDEYTGSPLLFKGWVKATVNTANGKIYKDMMINLDLNQDIPIFLNENNVYTFSESINGFTINDSLAKITFKRGKLISAELPNVLLEVISDLPTVLKQFNREVVEVPGYGNGSKSYRYDEGKVYYALINNKVTKISLTKGNAQKVFAHKWDLIEAFAKQVSKCFTTESGWRKMAEHYLLVQ